MIPPHKKMTPEQKELIDSMDYESLLRRWRFSAVGDPIFQDEAGKYFSERMRKLRSEPGGHSRHVAASKKLG